MLQASARMLPPSTLLANVTGTVHQNPAARSGRTPSTSQCNHTDQMIGIDAEHGGRVRISGSGQAWLSAAHAAAQFHIQDPGAGRSNHPHACVERRPAEPPGPILPAMFSIEEASARPPRCRWRDESTHRPVDQTRRVTNATMPETDTVLFALVKSSTPTTPAGL
ncbi:MAG: hypothetical protein R2856_18445 [Caldilineaceae bacterium]